MERIKLLDHFTLVEYNGVPYPEGYTTDIQEVAGHLDKDSIEETIENIKDLFDGDNDNDKDKDKKK